MRTLYTPRARIHVHRVRFADLRRAQANRRLPRPARGLTIPPGFDGRNASVSDRLDNTATDRWILVAEVAANGDRLCRLRAEPDRVGRRPRSTKSKSPTSSCFKVAASAIARPTESALAGHFDACHVDVYRPRRYRQRAKSSSRDPRGESTPDREYVRHGTSLIDLPDWHPAVTICPRDEFLR